MTDDSDYIERSATPSPEVARAERRLIRSGLGWWVAGLLVIIGGIAILLLMSRGNDATAIEAATSRDLTEAHDATMAAHAQIAALKATRSAQIAVANTVAATDMAARAATTDAAPVVQAANDQAQEASALTVDVASPQVIETR